MGFNVENTIYLHIEGQWGFVFMLDTGDVLDGKYRIIDYIGKGRWGRVFLAENLKIGNRWLLRRLV